MKKLKILIILLCSCFANTYAQVGINTTDPQEALHIAGSGSTIRVEGLDNTNNTNNLGGNNNYNLMVDTSGDLSLGLPSGLLQSARMFSTPEFVQTGANSELNSAQLYEYSFTLTQRALVVINYHISVEFLSFDGLDEIADGRAKIAHNFFYIGNGTTPDTPSRAYGMASSVYSNFISDAATNSIINSHSEIISLDPGTYSIHMFGAVFGGGLTADASFRGVFGNNDRLDISVIYL